MSTTTSSLQECYRTVYTLISTAMREGADDGLTTLRQMLRQCWEEMTVSERKPFLHPECLSTEDCGPINREFSGHKKKRKGTNAPGSPLVPDHIPRARLLARHYSKAEDHHSNDR